ncbi:MAG: sulfite exporter TauE/SafE family protein [Aquabacterium sp.]|nr:sulfite exporter TauE/SafE family protein [Aquabacterium sp.]
MLSGLMLTAFLMGLGGVPHCAAMCGAACAALLPRGVPLASLAGRCVGYALLGAVAATGFGAAAQWGRQMSFLQPLWLVAQALAFLLGLWLLYSGAMPHQLDDLGQGAYRALRARLNATPAFREGGALRVLWPFVAGMAWAMLPCGLLYAAVMVAALAPDAKGGAAVMLAFALPGAFGVWGAPVVLRRLARISRRGNTSEPVPAGGASSSAAIVPVLWLKTEAPAGDAGRHAGTAVSQGAPVEPVSYDPRWAVRLSGLMLALMSAWALYHQVMAQWRAWCA